MHSCKPPQRPLLDLQINRERMEVQLHKARKNGDQFQFYYLTSSEDESKLIQSFV